MSFRSLVKKFAVLGALLLTACDFNFNVSNSYVSTATNPTSSENSSNSFFDNSSIDSDSSSAFSHEHIFSDEWSYDENYHWHEAICGHDAKDSEANHTYREWIVVIESTESENGLQKRTCSVCGYEEYKELDLLPHTHTFSALWTRSETSHWHASTCGHDVKDSEANHRYGEWIVIAESTESENGLKKRTCSVCGYEEYKELDLLPHIHTFSTEWSKNVTSHWHASTCGHDVKDSEANHTYGEWIVVTESTESEKGHQKKTCSVCGYIKYSTEGLEYSLSEDCTYYIVVGIGNVIDSDIVIPNFYNDLPVKEIGDEAFIGCKSLTSIEILNSVISIGNHAFERCINLKSIEIPSSVTTIGENAINSERDFRKTQQKIPNKIENSLQMIA